MREGELGDSYFWHSDQMGAAPAWGRRGGGGILNAAAAAAAEPLSRCEHVIHVACDAVRDAVLVRRAWHIPPPNED